MKLIIEIDEDVYKKTVFYREFKDLNDCVTTIKALENGIPILDNATNGEWVDVKKRLPEDGTYLVTAERMVGTPIVEIKSFAKNLYAVDEFDFYDKKRKSGWYDYDGEYGYWEDDNVIAWMKLPTPYQKGGK